MDLATRQHIWHPEMEGFPMAGDDFSTGILRQQFVAEVDAAASQAATVYGRRAAAASPRSAFWIALGQVAQTQPGGSGRRVARPRVDLGRRVWRVLSGSWRALHRILRKR
jgi:hypothetical protein